MNALGRVLVLGALLFGGSACTTQGFCFDNCGGPKDKGDSGAVGPGDGGPPVDFGDGSKCPGPNCLINTGDAGGGKPACVQSNAGIEICDGKDNDCNGTVDDADFTDPKSCGNCQTNCTTLVKQAATATCTPPTSGLGTTAGTCGFTQCAPNFYDANKKPEDGCEYYCQWNPTGANTLDLGGDVGCKRDDDCDGLIDEDVDVCHDTDNCGVCGNKCSLSNAVTAQCVTTSTDGTCDTNNTHCVVKDCNPGFVDQDGSPDNGCEYQCTPTNGGVEICDGIDNDCDRLIDNADDSLADPLLGLDCQGGDKGICADPANHGVMKCIDGVRSCCDLSSNNVMTSNPARYPATGVRNDVCAGTDPPFVITPGLKPELCNALDDDCDGVVDGALTSDAGGVCGSGRGTCHTGHFACVTVMDGSGLPVSASLACPDATPPDPNGEICDGLDNDCDGVIDGTAPAPADSKTCATDVDCTVPPNVSCVALSADPNDKGCVALPKDIADPLSKLASACDVPPPPPNGVPQPCLAGRRACFGGTPVCVGSITQQQPTDRCFEDTNCNGVLDNQTGLVNADPKNCGSCGNDCTAKEPHAGWQCLAGVCKQTGCSPGFIECGGASPTDCETACTFDQTDELCDGIDNNCNCQIDEGNIPPPSVVQACGVAAGAVNDPGCNSSVTLACTAGNWKCTFTAPGYCTTGNCQTTPDICDGKDNNCDGIVDEKFVPPLSTVGFKGQGCFSDDGKALKDGQCQTQGSFICKPDGSDTTCSAAKDLSKVQTEICNGIDDDCNGIVDDTDPARDPRLGAACFGGIQGICALPAHAGVVSCILGAPVCGGPSIVHPGEVLETCNGLDDDCDGTKDNKLTDVGGLCGTSVGECTTGATVCANAGTPTAVVQCGVHVTPVPEICDGKDNDCNGQTDDSPTDVGTACNVPTKPPVGIPSPCKAGVLLCIGSTPVCQGSVTAAGGTKDACGEDTNCDGVLSNQTGLSNSDVLNCGSCGNNCNTLDPAGNSVFACQAGVCVHSGCKTGFIDCDGNANTCERACTVTSSTESCNGKDDDCNCKVDDAIPAVTSVQVCGVSPSATDAGCTSGVTTACVTGAWKCTFPAGYCTGATCGATAETCDSRDNNCNGLTDETFKAPFLTSSFLGQSCTTPAADGPCQGSGSFVCNAGGTATTCNAVKDNTKSKPETCNGIDDNCNGAIDDSPSGVGTQCFGGTQGECAAIAHAGATACQSGSIVCAGANLRKPGQVAETCNLLDDDCNGTPDDNPTDVGGACGSGIGACVPGTFTCVVGVKTCTGAIAGTPEKCNGIDDDCKNGVDDSPTDVGGDCNVPPAAPPATAQCPVVTETCKKGTLVCTSGVPVCQGSVTASAASPDGCCTDSNCDGTLTNQPNFQTDITNCGGCGINCNTLGAGKHGIWACQTGACVRTACAPGFINCDGVAGDCERACTFSGAELCNGADDDCNCAVDDAIPTASIPTPVQVCGVSATASDAKCLAGDGTSGVKVQCTTGAWKCTFPTGYCNQGTPAACSSTADSCDSKDNNCNGATDEPFKQPVLNVGYINQPCASDDGKPAPGDGACRGLGSYGCISLAATGCSAVKNPGAATQETCDAVDNDCDGLVDEPKATNVTGTYVKPAVVKVGAIWMYQYEASRPTATPLNPGVGDGYWCTGASGTGSCAAGIPQPPATATLDKTPACSVSGNIPWFNVTPAEAEQTCQAMGGSVCSTPNWTTACQATPTNCKWGYGSGCTSPANYSTGPFCNLGPFDFDAAATATNTDGLLPAGGGGVLNACYALWGGSAATSIFDITGNLREITKRGLNDYPLMGGAFNTMSEAGAQCDFTFYSVLPTFSFADAGFRCCFSTDPT